MSIATDRPASSAAAVLAIGATSPIGYGMRPTQAAMAAGLRNFQDAAHLDIDREPARVSRLPDMNDFAPRAQRIATLTRMAVADLLADAVAAGIPAGIPIFVGVADDDSESDLRVVGDALRDGSEGLIDPESATVFIGYRDGRIAFLSALSKAIDYFNEHSCEHALIVAADTGCTQEAVESRIRERRLLTSRDDGTIPGEAAVVALVASCQSSLAKQHAKFLVCNPAFGVDPFETIRQSPHATHGLGQAFRAIREHPVAGAVRAAAVVGFETGEVFFTRAFQNGYLRNAQLMPEPLQHESIAMNVGDTGCAAAGLALIRADSMLRGNIGEYGSRVLIYGHADSGRCAAAMTIGPQAQAD
jgi:hypothetical protein